MTTGQKIAIVAGVVAIYLLYKNYSSNKEKSEEDKNEAIGTASIDTETIEKELPLKNKNVVRKKTTTVKKLSSIGGIRAGAIIDPVIGEIRTGANVDPMIGQPRPNTLSATKDEYYF
jgi:hypothetical protein